MYLPDLKQPSAPISSDATGTILLVDDNDAFRGVISTFLQGAGYCVLEARTASEASTIATHPENTIDLLLTDVVLPGANGDQLGDSSASSSPKSRSSICPVTEARPASAVSARKSAHTCCPSRFQSARCCSPLPNFCTGRKMTAKSLSPTAPGAVSQTPRNRWRSSIFCELYLLLLRKLQIPNPSRRHLHPRHILPPIPLKLNHSNLHLK